MLAILIVAWFARALDWPKVMASLRSADSWWIIGAFCFNVMGLPLWIAAWRLLIPPARRPTLTSLFEAQSVTLAAIQALSGLGGGAVAIFMLVRRAGLRAGGALSLLSLDQLLTGLVKVIIIGAAIAFAPAPGVMRTVALTLLGVVAALLAVMFIVVHSEGASRRSAERRGGLPGKALALVSDLASHLAVIRAPGRFGLAILIYLARRSMEVFAAMCVQAAFGGPVSPATALLVVAALSIATILPGPPGNLGIYEAAAGIAYVACGIPSDSAVAMAMLQHLAFLAGSVLPGCVTLVVRQPWRRAVAGA